ncbi:urea ABC transporter substrate-binding protein [Halovibrio salipaludis]|uniref:Urea ABC transporter substrate-binding protein n=1 Tax=Halovibrio salipaludis TaxID=2032626 RepID=A0A2A2ETQ3_9GAMM|nr:urea ABC transporter substrate-binding protein [Halovibrio salipaludis]PAU75854.1 urea ABC transporter substrate-binding protein [Halovibrio salipaludis]
MQHSNWRKSIAALTIAALGGAGASAAGANEEYPTDEVNTTGLAVTDDTVEVGILHSLTGTMAISETGSVEAEQLAIRQINESGGVLGRQIETEVEDGASDWPTFAERASSLLESDDVAAVFGCWTSASRKAVLPVFEENNGLLYYPTFYEGLEASPNVFYQGQEATQQIIAGLNWVHEKENAETYYLIGSDYIWPRTSHAIARHHIENELGAEVVAEQYFPLGHTNFRSAINQIRLKNPDVVYSIIAGDSNVSFWSQLNSAGINADNQTVLTNSVTEDEVKAIGAENVEGHYSAMKYFQSLDNPHNKEFVEEFKEMHGEDSVIGDVTQAAYLGPWIWKRAVEKAESFDVDKVREAARGMEFDDVPEGYVRVHEENQHLWSKLRIGQWQSDGTAEVVYESDLIEPDPFPEDVDIDPDEME